MLINNIPENELTTCKLSDICTIKKGEQLNKDNMIDNGKYYVLNGGKNVSGYTDNWNTEKNTITISEGGNSCGYVSFNKKKFWAGGHCFCINNIEDIIYKSYLYHYLKTNERKIMNLRVGTGLPNIQKRDIENYKIKIPPIDKEILISEFLTFLMTKTDLINKQWESYILFKKGILQKMFC